jgi:hypothetical protein
MCLEWEAYGSMKCQYLIRLSFTKYFLFSPEEKKFCSKRELKRFLLETGSHLTMSASDFDFSVNGKHVKVGGKSTPPTNKLCPVMLLLKIASLDGIQLLH